MHGALEDGKHEVIVLLDKTHYHTNPWRAVLVRERQTKVWLAPVSHSRGGDHTVDVGSCPLLQGSASEALPDL